MLPRAVTAPPHVALTPHDIFKNSTETRSAGLATRLLMLTSCRLSEIQKLRWDHVDLDADEPLLPDTKTGQGDFLSIGRSGVPSNSSRDAGTLSYFCRF